MQLPHSSYAEKKPHKAYLAAVMMTITAAFGFLTAFVWRDIIIGILKKYKWYDVEDGFERVEGIYYAVGVAVAITLLAALFTVATVKLDAYYL